VALVVEGPTLARAADPGKVLSGLAGVAAARLPGALRVPLTVRYALASLDADPAEARTEYRFKVHIPREALTAGQRSVAALASSAACAFEEILASRDMAPFLEGEDPGSL
jgi:hypothetical protein